MSLNMITPRKRDLDNRRPVECGCDVADRPDLCRVKRCRSCFRDDIHFEVEFSPFLRGFLIAATFGLILIMRPSRCVCCGTLRVF